MYEETTDPAAAAAALKDGATINLLNSYQSWQVTAMLKVEANWYMTIAAAGERTRDTVVIPGDIFAINPQKEEK